MSSGFEAPVLETPLQHDQPSLFADSTHHDSVELFRHAEGEGEVVRRILTRAGTVRDSVLKVSTFDSGKPAPIAFDGSWLRGSVSRPELEGREVRIADLFAGCGGLTLGIAEACLALNLSPVPVFGADIDEEALDIYSTNFPTADVDAGRIEELLDGGLEEPATSKERAFRDRVGTVDVLVGGPPCQGHSDLNNHTRRDDPKNWLYTRMARAAEILDPAHVVIENVPGALHDKSGVVQRSVEALQKVGYHISDGLLDGDRLGVAQGRRRFFTVASKTRQLSFADLTARFRRDARTLRWAIEDLRDEADSSDAVFSSASTHSATNKRRIEYLFDHDLYDLPDSQRPDCHRLKEHSYRAVYGRLRWDESAPTITTGFGSMGQGRFVHPSRKRTLTPHEAARVQFFPDWFDFGLRNRGTYQKVIGNAVPPKMAYVIALELLR